MTAFKSPMIITSGLLLFIGFSFIALENIFYQYIDEDGVLHESLFMPLGFISLLLSLVFLLAVTIKKLISLKNNR